MNAICVICNRECEKRVYSSIGGQKVCSIRCAASVNPNLNDECANCGAVVWEDDHYNVNGENCCCQSCCETLRNKYTKKKSSSKKINYTTPVTKNTKKSTSKKKSSKKNQPSYNNYYQPAQDQFEVSPGMHVGGTNVAMGPRDWNTNDYDMGPGDVDGNYYHGDKLFAKYNLGEEDDSEAYGDVNERNYLDQYGPHKIVQKNENVAMDQIRQMGGRLKDNPNKPKNEAHSVVHRGYEVHCEYCDFIIKDGDNCLVDNFGKKFHTEECFSNYFQGIPKPNFG
jgi:hypothetical protein